MKYNKWFGKIPRIAVICLVFLGACGVKGFSIDLKTADFWREQVLYFVLLDRFENGCNCNDFNIDSHDPRAFHGGDLDGLRMRLDYLCDLGITGIWLSPTAKNRPKPFYGQQPYHGYWIWDFFQVDPRFGTLRNLRELRDDLHRREMFLLLDMVVNHAGYDAPLETSFPDWFHTNGEIRDWNNREQLESFKLFGLPDFASEKNVVQSFFATVAKFWVDTIQPDGFRLDAVKHVPNVFWKNFNATLRNRYGKGFMTLGELMNGDPAAISSTLKAGEFTSLFDFPLYYTLLDVVASGGDARQLGVRFGMDRVYPDAGLLATFLDNHDLDRFITSCGGNQDKYRLALTLLLTARGVPTLCYGDEIGLEGKMEPDCSNRRSMKFEPDNRIRSEVKKLIALRKSNPALTRGVQLHLAMSSDMYAFGRITPGQQAIAVFNFASSSREVVVPVAAPIAGKVALNDSLKNISATICNNELHVKLDGLDSALFIINADKPGAWKREHDLIVRGVADPFARGKRTVSFVLTMSEPVPEDASLHLIGGLPSLGEWNHGFRDLPRLVNCGNGEWKASLDLPIGAVFEYKFVRKTADGTPKWQEGNNSILDVNQETAPVIRHSWK